MRYKIINEEDTMKGSALCRVLRNRGIKDPIHYLNTTDDDIIDPATIKNVPEAAALLLKHINKGHKIFVNIDSDCDGYTSSAFMINWLYRNFPSFTTNYVSWAMHADKAHGLLMEQILRI